MNIRGIGDPKALAQLMIARGLIQGPQTEKAQPPPRAPKPVSEYREEYGVNELLLKDWLVLEAGRHKVAVATIRMRLIRGWYPEIRFHRRHHRKTFVVLAEPKDAPKPVATARRFILV